MSMKFVMVVDDSEADQLLAKMIIQEFDPEIKIVQAYDGQEALEVLKEYPKQPDVLFLDINMPRMGGYQFLEEYSKWENKAGVIVMLTSSNQEQDRDASRHYECVVKYLTKPLDEKDLESI